MAISMLKIRRPLGRLIFNMGIAIPGKTVYYRGLSTWSAQNISHCFSIIQVQLLTHPPDKMAAILADGIFKCIFLNANDRIPIQFSLKFVPDSPIDNNPALV